MNRSTLLATMVVLVAGSFWTSQPAKAQETPKETRIKSGPQAGKPIPGPFHLLAVTHAEDPGHKGELSEIRVRKIVDQLQKVLKPATDPPDRADLTKINRTIGKEPPYESKPKYCLVVFGPEAKTRVWLV